MAKRTRKTAKNKKKSDDDYLGAERRALLARALTHVAFDGWTAKALAAAQRDLGYAPDIAARAFPRGPADLIAFFNADLDRRMVAALDAAALAKLKIRERIALAVRTRLDLCRPHREAAGRAVAYYAQPAQALAGARAIARTVDLMWRAAGDTATDFNYYSKRALLAGVYTTTLAYWLVDNSAANEATWRFLDRRIADVMKIQTWRGRAAERLGTIGDLLARRGPFPRRS
ncbi:MAG: COQ9 family protein [Alphaproteobacteria bacterium]|nr:COQ9 family protein [Alphaproteobacteria bacterium]